MQPLSRTAREAIGYREVLAHLEGRTTLDDALDATVRRTRRFARRQRVWFRRDPRVHWVGAAAPESLLMFATSVWRGRVTARLIAG